MRNYIERGENLTVTALKAVASGGGMLVGAMFGVASTDCAVGQEVAMVRLGVFTLNKAAGTSLGWAQGVKLYWDNTALNVTTTASGNTLIGFAANAALAADTTGDVMLTGQAT